MHRSLAPRGLVAAAVLACPLVVGLGAGTVRDPAPEPVLETWHPVGGWAPLWTSWIARPDADDPFAIVPEEVLAHTVARKRPASGAVVRLAEVRVTFMPDGRELWLCIEDPEISGAPHEWLFVVRDPHNGAVSPEPARASAEWMWGEEPDVRFVDLDGDGRDEIAIDQHDHNGTAHDIREHHFFTVLPDLTLRLDLVQSVKSWESISERGAGYTRSQLLRSNTGRLRVEVWRESWLVGDPRTPLGRLDLARRADGRFEITASAAVASSEELAEALSSIEWMVRHPAERWKVPTLPKVR